MTTGVVERTIRLSDGVDATLSGDQLSLVGLDLVAVPSELAQHTSGVRKLDFSWNSLT